MNEEQKNLENLMMLAGDDLQKDLPKILSLMNSICRDYPISPPVLVTMSVAMGFMRGRGWVSPEGDVTEIGKRFLANRLGKPE